MKVRKATATDVKTLHQLINFWAEKGAMLPRSLSELYDSLRDFAVAEEDGVIIGCCSLHFTWEDLGEVRSLAVKEEFKGKGVGKRLLEFCLQEAEELGIRRVFVLTSIPGYFQKFGFAKVDKSQLPHKIWADCLNCPKFPQCDEVALVKVIE